MDSYTDIRLNKVRNEMRTIIIPNMAAIEKIIMNIKESDYHAK